jgi:hypothetical protein
MTFWRVPADNNFFSFLLGPEADIGTVFAFPSLLVLVCTPPYNRWFHQKIVTIQRVFKDVSQIRNANTKPL